LVQASERNSSRDKEKKMYNVVYRLTICGNSLAITLLPPKMLANLLGLAISLFGTESAMMDRSHTGNKEK
jgi:hypothetical protein